MHALARKRLVKLNAQHTWSACSLACLFSHVCARDNGQLAE